MVSLQTGGFVLLHVFLGQLHALINGSTGRSAEESTVIFTAYWFGPK